MRTVVNISLPLSLNRIVKQEMTKGHFTNKSEFFRSLLRFWVENKLLKELEESREELKLNKGKLLKSLADVR